MALIGAAWSSYLPSLLGAADMRVLLHFGEKWGP